MNATAPRQGVAVLRNGAQRLTGRLSRRLGSLQRGEVPPVRSAENGERTSVDSYWGSHTVAPDELPPPEQWSRGRSARQLEWRFEQYPLFREFSGLWGEHDGEVLVDYGCGPGNDLTGFRSTWARAGSSASTSRRKRSVWRPTASPCIG